MEALDTHDDALRMIRDSAEAIVPAGDLRRIRALRFTQPGIDRGMWGKIAEMGWIGLPLPEDEGGAGLGLDAFCVLAEELGRGLVPEPLIHAVFAARLLSGAARDEVLAGDLLVLPAWQERANTLGDDGGTVYRDGRLFGEKSFIPMAAAADAFAVTVAGGCVLVRADAPGVTLHTTPTQDGGHFGKLSLEGAEGEFIQLQDGVFADALDEATLALAAYLLGMMDQTLALTLDYLRTRKQFGRAIGTFQALQHKAVDLKLQVALTRASIRSAAAVIDASGPVHARRAAVSRAKARAAEAVMLVTRQAIQLHGAIGYTDEADIGLYPRKAMVLANLNGSAAAHRTRFDALVPETEQD